MNRPLNRLVGTVGWDELGHPNSRMQGEMSMDIFPGMSMAGNALCCECVEDGIN